MKKYKKLSVLFLLFAVLFLNSCADTSSRFNQRLELTSNSIEDGMNKAADIKKPNTETFFQNRESGAEDNSKITAIRDLSDYFEVFRNQEYQGSPLINQCRQEGTLVRLISETDDYDLPLNSLTCADDLRMLSIKGYPQTPNTEHERDKSYSLMGRIITQLYEFNMVYPVEKIRKIDDDHICVIYKANHQGNVVYNYKIYNREIVEDEQGQRLERWKDWGENYYLLTLISFFQLSEMSPGEEVSEDKLLEMMIQTGFYNDFIVKMEYNESDPLLSKNITYRATLLTKEGVAVITTSSETFSSKRMFVEAELLPYGKKSEQYPLISILADGFVPPLPDS